MAKNKTNPVEETTDVVETNEIPQETTPCECEPLIATSSNFTYGFEESLIMDDVSERNLYINGEIYQSNSHSECIKEYIENHFGKEEDVSSARQDGEEILEEYGLDELPIAFAHLVVNDPDVNKGIYLETGTIKGVSKQEVVNELKDQYGLKVYDNNSKKEI